MYSVVLLAALTATEKAPAHGWTKHHGYGACYGACYGGCYAGWPHANGGWGLPYGGYWAGYSCYNGHSYNGHGFGMHSPVLAPAPSTYAPVDEKADDQKRDKTDNKEAPEKNKKEPDPKKKGKDDKKDDADDKAQVRARLEFKLPQGASLYVDGQLVERADERKSFRTPPLERGEQYYYELRVEVVRDGRKYVENKKVTLSAGDMVKADFTTVGTTTGVATAEPAR
jgi:uncharacterized protein (TIGR03000 family)